MLVTANSLQRSSHFIHVPCSSSKIEHPLFAQHTQKSRDMLMKCLFKLTLHKKCNRPQQRKLKVEKAKRRTFQTLESSVSCFLLIYSLENCLYDCSFCASRQHTDAISIHSQHSGLKIIQNVSCFYFELDNFGAKIHCIYS